MALPLTVDRAVPPGAVPARPAPPTPGVLATVASIALLALGAGAPCASADVLRVAGDDAKGPVVVRTDGRRTVLPPSAWSTGDGAGATWFPSGLGQILDLDLDVETLGGMRPRITSVDGGPARRLPMPTVRRQFTVPYLFWDVPRALWNGDATAVTVGPVVTSRGARVMERCSLVPPLACRPQAIPDASPVAVLPDGRAVLATTHPRLVPYLDNRYGEWRTRSRRWVRTTRRRLNALHRERLWVEASGGSPRVVLRERNARLRAGVTNLTTYRGGIPSEGTLLQLFRARAVLRTRRRHGRLQASVERDLFRYEHSSWGEVTGDGHWRPRPEIDRSSFSPSASVPGGAWLGTRLEDHPDDRSASRSLPAVLRADGSVQDLQVGGQPLTARGLHLALGLPPADAPPAHRRDDFDTEESLRLDGYERGTDSAIVHYEVGDDVVAIRVPLDCRAPTLLDRSAFVHDGLPTDVAYLPF